ncbi:Ankyrin repeat domain-containing SOWAHD [Solea senegalensis]|uniref:Ankyrin repeat domain-containing SOWAHD n=1 Tax=Solea senegalensis TaxID=28829 RepID=A0AAV6SL09_SOLSE|nr:ankyrin repeat domain-containing protein SOWAHC [Solea senegalensis]KAG7518114.1 Ankyrin repeat domain-containing SOWAHD [Solea senegalensis]
MYESRSADGGCEATVISDNSIDAHSSSTVTKGIIVERLSRYGLQVMPSASQRRSRLQRQQEVVDSSGPLQREVPERASLTAAMRKKQLKDLLFRNSSNSGFNSALSSHTPPSATPSEEDAEWALYPMEHAWMLSAAEGNYDTLLEFISVDPGLLTRRDFISGYSVLHWLAKRGLDENLVKLLRYAETAGIAVNVNQRGSGGLTPLHIASMHGHYMVVKLLVGAFGANVDVMDYSGRRAWQYLRGDAPPEIKELLGTFDEEHGGGCGLPVNQNNNNAANATDVTFVDEVDGGNTEEVNFFDRTQRIGSWRFGSLRKMLPSFSFLGNKS